MKRVSIAAAIVLLATVVLVLGERAPRSSLWRRVFVAQSAHAEDADTAKQRRHEERLRNYPDPHCERMLRRNGNASAQFACYWGYTDEEANAYADRIDAENRRDNEKRCAELFAGDWCRPPNKCSCDPATGETSQPIVRDFIRDPSTELGARPLQTEVIDHNVSVRRRWKRVDAPVAVGDTSSGHTSITTLAPEGWRKVLLTAQRRASENGLWWAVP